MKRRHEDSDQDLAEPDYVYPPKVLMLVKYALVCHMAGRPLKKASIREYLDITSRELPTFENSANRYLKANMGLELKSLGTVPMIDGRDSPTKDELAVVSTVRQARSLIGQQAPNDARTEWGVLCFVLMLIVLHGQEVSLEFIAQKYSQSGLWPTEEMATDSESIDETSKAELHKIIQKLVISRALIETRTETGVVYTIGPYSRLLVRGRELARIILKLCYPEHEVASTRFQSQYKPVVDDLHRRIDATCLVDQQD